MFYVCENYEVERQRHNKQINYTQDSYSGTVWLCSVKFQNLNFVFITALIRDQRMTQDVDKFCDQMTQVLPNVILSPAIIAYYTYKTFQRCW